MTQIKIGNLHFNSPVMVGAGPIKTISDVKLISDSQSAAIVLGSITLKPRLGNKGKTYYSDKFFSINSRSMPNRGLEYYKKVLPQMLKITHLKDKPLIVSVAGFNSKEYLILATQMKTSGADMVELNFGCPNILKGRKHQPIVSFNEELIQKIISKLSFPVWIKLSPFSDPEKLQSVAKIVSKSKFIKAVVTTNTFPNAYLNNKVITPVDGLGGLSGAALKPIGLGQVKQLREILHPRIAIIGVGGILTQKDVKDYLDAGAVATQVTTAYFNSGPKIFSKIITNL